MKTNKIILIRPLIVAGLLIALTGSCKKEDDPIPYTEGAVTDIEGNVYKTIQIEIPDDGSKGVEAVQSKTQTWMAENLKTTRYNNGDLIETTTPATLDLSSFWWDPPLKYQWAYGGNESYVATYGRLYTWGAATDSRNICPAGWQVPTKAQWSQLAEYLGGKFVEDWEGMGYWTNVGAKLKEAGTTHWQSPNLDAVNSIGFTALPGGVRGNIDFYSITEAGCWWSQTEQPNVSVPSAWGYKAGYATRGLWIRPYYFNTGLSVRCVKIN
jgi:uncharacterized protein (TIGR02145 family)